MKVKKLTSVILAAILSVSSVSFAAFGTANAVVDSKTEKIAESSVQETVAETTEAVEAKTAEQTAVETVNETKAEEKATAEETAVEEKADDAVKAPKKAVKKSAPKEVAQIAADAETVTYVYNVTALPNDNDDGNVVAYEGRLTFPTGLSFSSLTGYNGTGTIYSNQKEDNVVYFNATAGDVTEGFDFSTSKAMFKATFTVDGTYDKSAFKTEISEFYTQKQAHTSAGTSLTYEAVLDGKTIAKGTATPGSDTYYDDEPEVIETTYNFVYTYKASPYKDYSVYEKAYTTAEDIELAANLAKPGTITSPYYSYEVGAITQDGNKYIVNLDETYKDYTVTFNNDGEKTTTTHHYEDIATFETDEESVFTIGEKIVAVGTKFSTFVVGDMIVKAEPNEDDEEEGTYAEINDAGHIITDNPEYTTGTAVKITTLSTTKTTSDKFARMGIAYATAQRTESEIKAAVSNITTGQGTSNKIGVYNALVTEPNVSGQYQFFFGAEFSRSQLNENHVIYFWSFLVEKDGTVTVSEEPVIARMSEILA